MMTLADDDPGWGETLLAIELASTLLAIELASTLLAIAAGADPFFVDFKSLFC